MIAAVAGEAALGAVRARAQERAADIAAIAARLGSDDPAARRQAYEALGSLPPNALPAIVARLAELRRARPEPERAVAILHAFRRAAGSRRADDLLDVADGIPAALEVARDRDVLRMAEPLLLLRSLERIGTTAALRWIPEVLRLDPGAWDMEGRRVTLRLGDRGAAAMILARAHPDRAGREWARFSAEELDLENPGRLVQRLEPRDLADVLEAWGETRSMDAMPVIASYLDDSRRSVREAARRALRAYGRHALWQAREQYRLRLGERANEAWSASRTIEELCRRLDARRLEAVADLARAAGEALARGDPGPAGDHLESLLARAPDAASDAIAEQFAALGDAWLARDDLERAHSAWERAIRIAPAHPDRPRWEARLTFVRAEMALARGVLDLEAYRRAARDDPSCARCAGVLASLEAQNSPRPDRFGRRREALLGAAALLALIGIALMWGPRGASPATPGEAAARTGTLEERGDAPEGNPADVTHAS